MVIACSSIGSVRAASRGRMRKSTSGRATSLKRPGLRRWYGHEFQKFEGFRRRFLQELARGRAPEVTVAANRV
jgi:uncharacterized protein YeaO (DUF488 family)